jgi:hypothetical protein
MSTIVNKPIIIIMIIIIIDIVFFLEKMLWFC